LGALVLVECVNGAEEALNSHSVFLKIGLTGTICSRFLPSFSCTPASCAQFLSRSPWFRAGNYRWRCSHFPVS